MGKVTPKQQRFAELYTELGNATEAYVQAYANNCSRTTARKRARELVANPSVSAIISELQAEAAEAAKLTLTAHLQRLDAISHAAEAARQFGAAAAAEIARGKAAGLYKERIEADIKSEISEKPVSSTRIYDARTGRTIRETFDDGRVITYEPDTGPIQVCADEAPQIFVATASTDENGQTVILDLPDNGRDDDVNEAVARAFSGNIYHERIVHDAESDTTHIFQYPNNGREIL